VTPPKHTHEEARLAALQRYHILDTDDDPAFDDLTQLIADICEVPIAVINLIDRERQWFKSEIGLGVRETPLDISICAHAILEPDLFVVPDTLGDARFVDNPLVTGDPRLRFYAGALLESSDGYPLGTLCVLDYTPRELSDRQKRALRTLAREVMTQMELRAAVARQATVIAEKEAAQCELAVVASKQQRIAETLQLSLLLAPPPDSFPGLAVHTVYEAAWDEAQVGGDFVDAFALRDGKVALVVGDVTGKGLQAAAHTAQIKYALRALLSEEPNADPALALARLNRYLLHAQRMDAPLSDASPIFPAMVALCLVVVTPETGAAFCAAGGAEPPLVLRAATAQAEQIRVSGSLLGAQDDVEYEAMPLTLARGDVLVIVTDGVTEARAARRGPLFGYEGLVKTVRDFALSNEERDDLGRAIVNVARGFANGQLQDDTCVLTVRRL